MQGAALRALLAAVCLSALLLVVGCGGDGEEGSSSTASTAPDTTAPASGAEAKKQELRRELEQLKAQQQQKQGGDAKPPSRANGEDSIPAPAPVEHDDSGGGAAQFHHKGSDNSIQEFGSEASSSERDEAAEALHGFLDARAARDWDTACTYMSADLTRSLEALLAHAPKAQRPEGCAEILAGLSARVSDQALADVAKADVGSLRRDGERGFILYHGVNGDDYAMPMALEGGEWKVGALEGSPLL